MKTKRRNRYSNHAAVNLGFQIAPMIDVVFVILLFFMVKASDVQVENSQTYKLPSDQGYGIETPDEIAIAIGYDGQVYLNEDPLDDPESKTLPDLAGNLSALKQSADSTQSRVLVTIYADEQARYQRVVDVLDALTRAKISGVTFQVAALD